MASRVLITGAQGFVGRYAVAQFLSGGEGMTVVGVGRSRQLSQSFTHYIQWNGVRRRAPLPHPLATTLLSERYRYVQLDIRFQSPLIELIKEVRPSIILHLAGALRDEPASRLFSQNVVGTGTLFDAIAAAAIPPPRVVLGSTGSLYGNVPSARLPIQEAESPSPFDLYSASKEAAERIAWILSEQHDIPTIYARIFNVVGPGQDERHICGWLARQMVAIRAGLQQRVEVGPLSTTRDFIDVRDVARALFVIAYRGTPGGRYNIGSGIETPIREVFDYLLESSGLDEGVEISPRPERPTDCPRLVADVRRLRALGYTQEFCLPQSLSDLLEYYASGLAGNGGSHSSRATRPTRRSQSSDMLEDVTVSHRHLVQARRDKHYDVRMVRSLLDDGFGAVTDKVRGRQSLVVCSPTVARLYGERLYSRLQRENGNAAYLVLRCREATKDLDRVVTVCRAAQSENLDRRAVLIGMGGGVVTDIVTIAASWIRRGIEHLRIPTTLIGQVDAGIGIKGGVNLGAHKSYIGVFNPPISVLVDTAFLDSLPAQYIRFGLAEIIKIAVVRDPQLFHLVEDYSEELACRASAPDPPGGELVWRSIMAMLEELQPNLYEDQTYERLVDFGHTFSPALESDSGYTMHHGEAVSIDMALSAAIAVESELLAAGTLERIVAALSSIGLPTWTPLLTIERCERSLAEAAHHRGGSVNLVVPTAIGHAAFLRGKAQIPRSLLRRAIKLLKDMERGAMKRLAGLILVWSLSQGFGL